MNKYNVEKITPTVIKNIEQLLVQINKQRQLYEELRCALLHQVIKEGIAKVVVASDQKSANAVWPNGEALSLTFEETCKYGPTSFRYWGYAETKMMEKRWRM